MLLTSTDFNKYKKSINEELDSEFLTNDEFENYLKEKLNCDNIRIVLSNIFRALNIINNKDKADRIQELTEIELLIVINIKETGSKLLELKDKYEIYISNLDDDMIEILEQLTNIFKNNYQMDNLFKINEIKEEKIDKTKIEKEISKACSFLTIFSFKNIILCLFNKLSEKDKKEIREKICL